jgi:hypothetical protein
MKKEVGSGSISQRYGSGGPEPDPHQNFTDPQHLSVLYSVQPLRVAKYFIMGHYWCCEHFCAVPIQILVPLMLLPFLAHTIGATGKVPPKYRALDASQHQSIGRIFAQLSKEHLALIIRSCGFFVCLHFAAVFRSRIRMFLGLLDPEM